MSTDRRNHFIPIVLLRRFASRTDGPKKAWIWQIGQETKAVEISLRDAAVGSYFYGKAETSLEGLFKQFETSLGVVLNDLDSGADPGTHGHVLRSFIYLQMLRTRALREQFADTSSLMLDKLMAAATPERVRGAATKELDANFDQYVERELARLPKGQRDWILRQLNQPGVREAFKEAFFEQLEEIDVGPAWDVVLKTMRNEQMIPTAAAHGQIRGLTRLLGGEGVPDSFFPKRWHLVTRIDCEFVLGDCCVIGRSTDGEIGSPLRFAQKWSEIYLPISPDQVLVACNHQDDYQGADLDINAASASLSRSYVYSNCASEAHCRFSSRIGEACYLLPEEDVSELVENAWEELQQQDSH